MADKAGLDTIWASEHHFSSYMTSPNLCQILAYVVARTKNADIGTAVIVLPWHDPVRVAEEVAMLDIMVGQRKLFVGFGRGASTLEFEGFRVPMNESRGRYNEALEIVRTASDHRAVLVRRRVLQDSGDDHPSSSGVDGPYQPDVLRVLQPRVDGARRPGWARSPVCGDARPRRVPSGGRPLQRGPS